MSALHRRSRSKAISARTVLVAFAISVALLAAVAVIVLAATAPNWIG
jgi:hypothetical protein